MCWESKFTTPKREAQSDNTKERRRPRLRVHGKPPELVRTHWNNERRWASVGASASGVRQSSGAFNGADHAKSLSKAPEDWRTPRPCGSLGMVHGKLRAPTLDAHRGHEPAGRGRARHSVRAVVCAVVKRGWRNRRAQDCSRYLSVHAQSDQKPLPWVWSRSEKL
jgi:hypothetical protein